jgi:hypothetical protein
MKKTEELPAELTAEEITVLEQNCVTLATKHNVAKVHLYVGLGEGNERIVGYIKDPSYVQKIMAMGKISTVDPFVASEDMRSALTLTEESDPRTYSTAPDCDKYRLGMATACLPLIEVAVNTFKKK